MDHRCLRAHSDTLSGSLPDERHQTSDRRNLPRGAEPSTAALLAVIVGALIVGAIVVALARIFNKTQVVAPDPGPHPCHLEGDLLMRCDNDL